MERKWWKESVVYQVYLRSFLDSNADGVGDLRGLIRKLDHISALGADVIWLSPVYRSPNDDNGYDISDYREIMDEFGTMADMDELIREVHCRGMRLVMDLVVNHTSDEHPWFVRSRCRRDDPYRDYYIWREGRNGGPPNNWGSFFGGSAWEYDQTTGEYYLHLFSRRQPDLNWENPRVRQEVRAVAEWWLGKGVDGFRLDTINSISKVQSFPDGPVRSGERFGDFRPYCKNGPRVHEFLRELHDKVFSRHDIMTVGETSCITPETAAEYVSSDRRELNTVFHFDLMDLDHQPQDKWSPRQWKLTEMKRVVSRWYEGLRERGWNAVYLGNHDQPRLVSRFADDRQYRKESAKMLATLLLTLPGTPYIYQGDEIGMTNVHFDDIADYRDIETLNMYRESRQGRRMDEEDVMEALRRASRDNARTPMQWDATPHAGFTGATPWIKVNPNYLEINVAGDARDPGSVFRFYQQLIRLRKTRPVLVYGDYAPLLEGDESIWAYLRELEREVVLVLLNFSPRCTTYTLPPAVTRAKSELLIANRAPDPSTEGPGGSTLRPYEARVCRLG